MQSNQRTNRQPLQSNNPFTSRSKGGGGNRRNWKDEGMAQVMDLAAEGMAEELDLKIH